jgi:hypothetical protein
MFGSRSRADLCGKGLKMASARTWSGELKEPGRRAKGAIPCQTRYPARTLPPLGGVRLARLSTSVFHCHDSASTNTMADLPPYCDEDINSEWNGGELSEGNPGLLPPDAQHPERPIDPKWTDVALMRTWIQTCIAEHGPACWPEDSLTGSPLWLIDVNDQCLVPYSQERAYVALSYTRGQVESAETRKDNLHAFQQPGAFAIENSLVVCDESGQTKYPFSSVVPSRGKLLLIWLELSLIRP